MLSLLKAMLTLDQKTTKVGLRLKSKVDHSLVVWQRLSRLPDRHALQAQSSVKSMVVQLGLTSSGYWLQNRIRSVCRQCNRGRRVNDKEYIWFRTFLFS